MTDWSKPLLTDTWANFLSGLLNRDLSAAKLDYSADTNIPANVVGYNTSSNKFERFNGSSWANLGFHSAIDSHIADTSIHSSVPIGAVIPYAGATAPTGWLLCDGSAVNRTTYNDLFLLIGVTYGAGNGSTTFNLPDLKQRFPLGKSASGTGDTLGATGGAIDHTHSTPTHTHTIPTHTHDLGNHTHQVGAHTHPIAAHEHSVPAHNHDTQGSGATIAINTNSGSHTHTIAGKEGGSSGTGANRPLGASSSSGSNVNWSNVATSSTSDHTHDHTTFAGKVGNVTSGNDGDVGFSTTGGSSLSATSNSTAFASGAPSSNTSGGSGTLTSSSGEGGGTSGTANPPFIALNYIIKYQ